MKGMEMSTGPYNALAPDFSFMESPANQANDASSSSFAISSVGIAMMTMLETLLPAAASEVERESMLISQHFSVIAGFLNEQTSIPEAVQKAMMGMIVGMQFQDRNTQVMDNVAGMLERYRSMLEEVCGNIETLREGSDAKANNQTVARAVEEILSSIRLSDIRARYLDALAKAKMHESVEVSSAKANTEGNDIELF